MNVAIKINEQATSKEYEYFMAVLNELTMRSQSLKNSIAFLLINEAQTKMAYYHQLSQEEEDYIHKSCYRLVKQAKSYVKDQFFEYYIERTNIYDESSFIIVVFPLYKSEFSHKKAIVHQLRMNHKKLPIKEDFFKEVTFNILKKTKFQIRWTELAKSLIDVGKRLFYSSASVTVLEKVNEELMIVASSDSTIEQQLFWKYPLKGDSYCKSQLCKWETDGEVIHQLVLPIHKNLMVYGYIVFSSCDKIEESLHHNVCSHLEELCSLFAQGYELEKIQDQSRDQHLLLQVTKKLNSSMKSDAVIMEIIDVIQEVFIGLTVKVLVTHEWTENEHTKKYVLNYRDNGESATIDKVYLSGKIEMDINERERTRKVYAPLRGRQGIYGVFEISTDIRRLFTKNELAFIELLADIGGNALENAELYQQSQQLIYDLQLINQTSKEINSNLKFTDTVDFIKHTIIKAFDAEEIGILLTNQNQELSLIKGSTSYFQENGINQELGGLIERLTREMDAIYIARAHVDPILKDFPYQSVLTIPMMRTKKLEGLFIVMHREPVHFSFDHFKLLQAIIQHCTLAFTNSMIHEELERLVITDHLTDLYARGYLNNSIEKSFQNDREGAFLLLDIDNFKQINDTYGHQVGDEILVQVGNLLKEKTRQRDIVARWGGEELAVYLPQADRETGYAVASRIVKAIAHHTEPKVTVSCGISFWEKSVPETKQLKDLFEKADKALYAAKNSGKNKVVMS
ncbi:sensor domain-containing diguanylate cyclase [Alkalihalobacillus pseudalcaliphilus]|uniref:sensor domain-containing diguanylate cyclase n=1 Tax=Alkalihalobacillus pseudalcaliphilus TaxID=79884 RepID=UPI000A06B738|nr:sensor domain-containing diguanylate cyclase [Alkalihalobacillus pseudalcaliphilus]